VYSFFVPWLTPNVFVLINIIRVPWDFFHPILGICPVRSGMAENGIIPGANIYHPEVNSSIGSSIGRIDKEYIRDLYSFAAELYTKYNYKPFFNASVLRNSLANEYYEGLL
jgi:hypothetical protein